MEFPKRKRLFNLDLHISVIQDIKYNLKTLYGDNVEIVNWSISGHNWVFGNPTPDISIINQSNWWKICPRIVEEFQKKYDDFLLGFDGFIVTHTPVFCMLYEKYKKPIFLVNTCRYEQPYGQLLDKIGWEWLNAGLARMAKSGQLIAMSNNKADQEYLRLGAGVQSTWIPSLCLYTCASYNPLRDVAVVYGDRGLFPPSEKLVAKPDDGYSWKDLYTFKAIVHVPYEISTMSIFEQYSAGVPLFLPSARFYKSCISDSSMKLISIYSRTPLIAALQMALTDVDFWLTKADYYDSENMKFVYFYNSFEDCVRMIESFNESPAAREKRAAWLAERRAGILARWAGIFSEFVVGGGSKN